MSIERQSEFTRWLGLQRTRTDRVGELARDVYEDASWPEEGASLAEYESYFSRHPAFAESRIALEEAWNECMDRREWEDERRI